MSEEEQLEWERRYQEGGYRPRTGPSPHLVQFIEQLPRGRALDVACGTGRNALLLAEHGYQVDAIDVSEEALRQADELAQKQGLQVHWIRADLDSELFPAGVYQAVTCSFYFNRSFIPRLKQAVAEGGYLLFEQHLRTSLPVAGPRNQEWRLEPNELLRLFHDFRIVYYEEGATTESHRGEERTLAVVRMVACKGSGGF